MEKLLIAVNHQLTNSQISELPHYEVTYLRDENPGLFARLGACPADQNELVALATEFWYFVLERKYEVVFGPIGSPALMFMLGQMAGAWSQEAAAHPDFIFSFSERVSVETPKEGGSVVKSVVFKHLGYQCGLTSYETYDPRGCVEGRRNRGSRPV